jgi:hypothetical protein
VGIVMADTRRERGQSPGPSPFPLPAGGERSARRRSSPLPACGERPGEGLGDWPPASTTHEKTHAEIADETEAEPGWRRRREGARRVLLIACGALAREILALREGPLGAFDVTCLPAQLHNRPERIPEAVRRKIRANRAAYDEILCLYGDCGTGGALDRVLEEEGVARIAGPHCYAFFAGEAAFEAMMAEEPGTFFLTDFLARHFDRLVIEGLGLDRFPQLRDDYFGHYRRLVYLAQTDDAALDAKAEAAARRLALAFERRFTGFGGLARFVESAARKQESASWPA